MVFFFRKSKNHGIRRVLSDDGQHTHDDDNISFESSLLLKSARSSDNFYTNEQETKGNENLVLENSKTHRLAVVPESEEEKPARRPSKVEQPSTKTRGRIPLLRAPPSSTNRRSRKSISQPPPPKSRLEATPTTPQATGQAKKGAVTPDTDLTSNKTPSPSGSGFRVGFGSRRSASVGPSKRLFRSTPSSKKQEDDLVEVKEKETPAESVEQSTALPPQELNHEPEAPPPDGLGKAHQLLKTLSFQSSMESNCQSEADDNERSIEILTLDTAQRQEQQKEQLLSQRNNESTLQSLAEQPDVSLADTMFPQMPAPSPIGKVSSPSQPQRRIVQDPPISHAPVQTAAPVQTVSTQRKEKMPPSILRSSSKKKKLDPPEEGGQDRPVDVISTVQMKRPQLNSTSRAVSRTSSSKHSRSSSTGPSRGTSGSASEMDEILSDGGGSRTTGRKTGDYDDGGTYDDRTYGTDTSLRQEFRQALDETAQKVIDAFRCNQNLSAKQILANPTGVMALFYDQLCTSQEQPLSGVSESLSRRPYYSEIFTREWLLKMTTVGVSLLYLQAPNSPGNELPEWKGRTVQLMIATGTTGNLVDIQPKLEWSTMAGGQSNMIMTTSMPLLKIYSILTSSSSVGDSVMAGEDDIGGCFLTITSESGDVHMFEANSMKERNDILNGLRNVITRLSFHLITGDATASVELYKDDAGLEEGELPSLPNPRLNMNRIAHALLDG